MSRVTGARCDESGKVAGGVGNWSSVMPGMFRQTAQADEQRGGEWHG